MLGQPRAFFALVTEPAEYARINALQSRYGSQPVPEEEVKQLRASYVRLELIPRGTGRLDLLVDNHVLELGIADTVALTIEILNRGNMPVHNIHSSFAGTPAWECALIPELLPVLDAGQSLSLQLLAHPATRLGTGDHDFIISAQGQVGEENIEAPEEHLTVHLSAPTNWTLIALLVGALLVLLAAMALASLRLARR